MSVDVFLHCTNAYTCMLQLIFLQLNFILPLLLGMLMYDNKFKTKEEYKIKHKLQHVHIGS